jgi:hypothetical protein
MGNAGRGKRREQRKRRRKITMDSELYKPQFYELVDLNFTHYPYAYCTKQHGFITKNMCRVHNCEKIVCPYLDKDINKYEKQIFDFIEK